MEPRIWINQLEFNNLSTIQIDENDIVVFVGPNNAGKSVSLQEIASLFQSNSRQGKIVKKIEISKQGNEQDFIEFIDGFTQKEFSENPAPYYKGLGFRVYEEIAISMWNSKDSYLGDLTNVFINFQSTEARLFTSNPAQNIKLTVDAPTHPIHYLQKNDTLEKTFSSYFRQAFGTDLLLHRNAGSEVPFYVGETPPILQGEDRVSESYLRRLEELAPLRYQGDGMRSFVGVLLNAFISHQSILFIDEPEAFLHPPQARLLGKMLAKDLPAKKQLFLATHSTDFLKGLLESNNPNIKIIRIQRHGTINKVNVLDKNDVNSVWSDPLLRHSNILDGLFHTQVVICESDSDCRFYSAILSSVHEKKGTLNPDVLFVHCGGKHRIPTVVKALKQLDVTIKTVADFDVLNNINPIQDIYTASGGDWNDIENDWKTVKTSIDSKRPELETKELQEEINAIFDSTSEKIIPKEKITAIQQSLRKASPWAHAKEVGKSFIPSGNATSAFNRLQNNLKSKGIFIVEAGQLESFVKSVGGHGPKWVNEVLAQDLTNNAELLDARNFIEEVATIK